MKDYREIYNKKKGSLDDALALIKSGDTIVTSMYGNEPNGFLKKLHLVSDRVQDVTLWVYGNTDSYQVMSDHSLKGKIDISSFFYNADCRKGHSTGRITYLPINLHSTAAEVVRTKRPNVFVAATSPMDEDGNVYVSFDLEGACEWIDEADIVIFEVNENIPRTYGETALPIEKATMVFENKTPLPNAPIAASTEIEKTIAGYVSELIDDGSCIQLGIGGMPNTVGRALLDKHDLGIHTEMLTASMGELIQKGVVNNSRKTINKGKTIAAFAWGDENLYKVLANNENISMRRVSYANDPFIIARNDNMVSVNTAMEVDLTGQICSESIGSLQFSGSGGASDFAYGAYHSNGGKGIIAFASTTKNGTISKIKPVLTPGAIVSISRNIADYIVTEHGVARLRGKCVRDRVNELISIAHPDFRGELKREAEKLMLW